MTAGSPGTCCKSVCSGRASRVVAEFDTAALALWTKMVRMSIKSYRSELRSASQMMLILWLYAADKRLARDLLRDQI